MPLLAVATGTGWVYLLRELHVLALGPRLDGALPLQQLAGGDAEPLIRMVVAWLPAGVAAGLALDALTPLTRLGRAALAALLSAAMLIVASAVSDSIAQNDAVHTHLSAAASQGAVWLAAGLIGLGVVIAPRWVADSAAAASRT
ncbi:MAG: hypothetical protein ACXVRH_14375 [Thermoleophilaceae bacterium]